MTTLTPIQKARLAKLLGEEDYKWIDGGPVMDTEWPYVIERIKERMTDEQREEFSGTIKVSREPEYDDGIGWLIEGAFADISEVADALWQTLGKEEA